MIIGYDAKRAIFNLTGLGNYSRSLVRSLSARYQENTYLLYSPKYRQDPRLDFLQERSNVAIRTPSSVAGRVFTSFWRSRLIGKQLVRDGVDLYHGLSNELPHGASLSRMKTVVTIHDLIFLRYPELYHYVDRKIYAAKSRHACRIADRIVAVSEQTKRDIVDFLGVDPHKVTVIYQSCDPIFQETVAADQKQLVRSGYNLPANYLLYVGTIERRKNLLGAIKALELIGKSDLSIVVIGEGHAYKKEVIDYARSHRLGDKVLFLDHPPFADFPAIYQMASVFVFPSLFEGFGIPIIEALWSKTPVVTSTGSCLAEAGGPSSIYVPPTDHRQLAEAITRVLRDPSLRARMTTGGYSYVQRFHEKNTAEQMMALYYDVAENTGTRQD